MTDRLAELSRAGVSIWLDDLSRDRLTSGSLASLVARDHVAGVTTNPTIFAKAISGGDEAYAGQLHDLWARGTCVHEALRDLTTHDVRWACDVLRPTYDASDGVDGRASIEVDPRLAYDTEATIAEARALWWQVDRPNLFIKIAAAREGLPAITACLAEGISINVTLIFSLTRYDEVIDAFLEGLERARQVSRDLAPIASVASFFVSGWTPRSTRGWTRSAPPRRRLRGRAAIANPARLAYQLRADARLAALGRSGGGGAGRSGRCGPRPRSRTRPPRHHVRDQAGRARRGQHHARATLRAVADHGEVPADSVRAHYSTPGRCSPAGRGRRRLRRRHGGPGAARPGTVRRQLAGLSDQLAAKLRNPCHS